MRERSIIHINVADFAVSVERLVDRRLRDRPVIVAPVGSPRAVVYDMSNEAYADGVRKGMALGRANKLCRGAVLLPPHPERYGRAMQEVFKRVLSYSPLVEMTGNDGHLFIDVTGTHRLFGPPPDIAWRIRNTLRKELDLNPVWSLAANKLVAKVASRLVKPQGEYIVPAGDELPFLTPLPMVLLPGVKEPEYALLQELNLNTAGEVNALSLPQLSVLFSRRAHFLYEAVRGIDLSPVLPAHVKAPCCRAAHTFVRESNNAEQIAAKLRLLVEETGASLRRQGLAARRVGVWLDYTDGVQVTRQATTAHGEANDFYLLELAKLALRRAWKRRVRLRRLCLVCDRLIPPSGQLELFAKPQADRVKKEKVVAALDTIRQRFGSDSVKAGCLAA